MPRKNNYGKSRFPYGWLVVILALGAGAYHWGPALLAPHQAGGPQGGMPPGGMPASVAEVVSGQVSPWRDFSGMFEAVGIAEVRPRVSGQVTEVLFKDGAEVKRGQPLFTIDPRPYEAELQRASGVVVSAKAAFASATKDISRAKTLIKAKAISQAEFEQRTSAFEQAQGALQQAQGALAAAQTNLSYAHITAPISGKISRAEVTVGNQVEAGGNAPLLTTIVAQSPIYASFDVDEATFLTSIAGVATDKLASIPVEVGLSRDKETPMKATIHDFDNRLHAGSGTIRVRALVENRDGQLVPGLFARVRIGAPEAVQALLINPAAIGTDQNKKFVLVVDGEGKAEYREVVLGSVVDGLQIVSSGLKAGEKIVVSGLQRLRPGVPVKAMPVDMNTLKPVGGDAAAPAAETPAAGAK